MENWGLITFREKYLLVDSSTSTLTTSLVAIFIAHELSHFWFGNLVTMVYIFFLYFIIFKILLFFFILEMVD